MRPEVVLTLATLNGALAMPTFIATAYEVYGLGDDNNSQHKYGDPIAQANNENTCMQRTKFLKSGPGSEDSDTTI